MLFLSHVSGKNQRQRALAELQFAKMSKALLILKNISNQQRKCDAVPDPFNAHTVLLGSVGSTAV